MRSTSLHSLRRTTPALILFVSLSIAPAGRASAENATLKTVFDALPAAGDVSTQIRILPGNEEAWYTRWKMVESAKKTIDATYYIVSKDVFGQAFLGHLLEKARQGVKVRLMIDWRIAYSSYMTGVQDQLQEMTRNPNVEIRLYNSAVKELLKLFSDPKALVAADHDKIMVIDGELAITGGRNIGADYFAGPGEFDVVYRDTDVLLRGKYVAGALKQAFETEWDFSQNSRIKPDVINLVSQKENLKNAYTVMSRYLVGEQLPARDPKLLATLEHDNLNALLKEIER